MIYGYFVIICGLFFVGFVDWRYVCRWIDDDESEINEDLYESMDVNQA